MFQYNWLKNDTQASGSNNSSQLFNSGKKERQKNINEIINNLDFEIQSDLNAFKEKYPKIYYHLEEFALKSKNDKCLVFEAIYNIEEFIKLFPWKIDDIIEIWYSFWENVDYFLSHTFPTFFEIWIDYKSTIILFKKLAIHHKKLSSEAFSRLTTIDDIRNFINQVDWLNEREIDLLILKYSLVWETNITPIDIEDKISDLITTKNNIEDQERSSKSSFISTLTRQQLISIADIIEKIEIYLEDHITENDLQFYFHTNSYTDNLNWLFYFLWNEFSNLDKQLKDWIYHHVVNTILSRKYQILRLSNNWKSSKELLEMYTWKSWFIWDIEVSFNNYNVTFFISNDDDYNKVWHQKSWWQFIPKSNIKWLERTLIIVRWNYINLDNDNLLEVASHEWQHAKNSVIMSDYKSDDILWLAKDEIISFMAYWREWKEIFNHLAKKSSNWWIYDYLGNIETKNSNLYKKKWVQYQSDLANAIAIAERFRIMQVPNYLNLLAIVPIREWWVLYKKYFW